MTVLPTVPDHGLGVPEAMDKLQPPCPTCLAMNPVFLTIIWKFLQKLELFLNFS